MVGNEALNQASSLTGSHYLHSFENEFMNMLEVPEAQIIIESMSVKLLIEHNL